MVDRSMDRPDISASQQRHRLRHATLPTIFHPKYRGNCCDAHSPVVIICPNIGTAEEGLNNQVVPFKSPADPPQCPECCGNPRLCAAVPEVQNPFPSSGESANPRSRSIVIDK